MSRKSNKPANMSEKVSVGMSRYHGLWSTLLVVIARIIQTISDTANSVSNMHRAIQNPRTSLISIPSSSKLCSFSICFLSVWPNVNVRGCVLTWCIIPEIYEAVGEEVSFLNTW